MVTEGILHMIIQLLKIGLFKVIQASVNTQMGCELRVG